MTALVRRMAIVLVVMAVPAVSSAQHLGRTITDVRVEIAGRPVSEATVLGLVETRIGEPLAMLAVRSTIDHLVGLGRFEDVRVMASPSDQGVALRWLLVPLRRIARVSVTGSPVLSASAIRTELTERFGTLPAASRVPDMVTALEVFYADRGFSRATILPRIEETDPMPERAALVLTINAGERVTIGSATVTGSPLEGAAEVLRAVDVQTGRPWDRPGIEARVADYEESLRQRGYYEARVRESHVVSEDGRTVSVTVEVISGPRVRVVFAGDALPEGDPEDLVLISQERSIDQDLLDDSSAAIENALRAQGYREARAPYTRRESAGELVLTFTIARGALHRVESIDVTGMSGLDRAAVTPLLQIKPGEPYVFERVRAVAAAMTELYRVRGFASALVAPRSEMLPPPAGATHRPVAVRFDVEEGAPTVIRAVNVEGATAISAEALKARLVLGAGRPFYRPQLAVDRDSLERAYRNEGYQNVSVNSQLAFADNQRTVSLTWIIREGDRVTIDRILINGNNRVSADLIRREMTIQPGSPMSDEAIIDSQRRLAALGLFRRVRISELPRSGSLTRDVLVDLEEADTTTIDFGGGLEVGRISERDDDGVVHEVLDFGPRGFFAISRRNLWGKNRSVTLFGRVTLREDREDTTQTGETTGWGFHDYRGLFTFREPRAFGTTGDAQFTAFVEQAQRTSYTFNRKGLSADYARRIGAFTVSGRYTLDYTKLFDEQIAPQDQLPIDRLFPQVRLSKIFGGVLRDSRDDILDPQTGTVVGVDGSWASKALGSEVGFVKTFMQGFIYRRVPGRRVVVAAGARVGLAVGFGQSVEVLEIARPPADGEAREASRAATEDSPFDTAIRDLPASERFFAGGDTTVRGFALDRLGTEETLDPDGFPQGGNGLAVFNLEARAPYWKNLQFVWFMDAGNVFPRASDIDLGEIRVTSGVGFRYRSPIGPLRVDWGWKLSTRLESGGSRERSNVLHISLGQAF
jgi:outer membrane protein insertion porin family